MNVRQVAIIVLVLFMLWHFVTMFTGWRTCSADGGTYVRGMFGMECVE